MAQLWVKVKKYLEANSKTWDVEKKNLMLQNIRHTPVGDGKSNTKLILSF